MGLTDNVEQVLEGGVSQKEEKAGWTCTNNVLTSSANVNVQDEVHKVPMYDITLCLGGIHYFICSSAR